MDNDDDDDDDDHHHDLLVFILSFLDEWLLVFQGYRSFSGFGRLLQGAKIIKQPCPVFFCLVLRATPKIQKRIIYIILLRFSGESMFNFDSFSGYKKYISGWW